MIRMHVRSSVVGLTSALAVALVSSAALAQWPPPAQQAPQDPAGSSPGSTQPASPYDPSMQAGGLTPPPPMDPSAPKPLSKPPEGTEVNLDEAKKKDSGRGLSFVWLGGEGGFQYVDLQTFNVDETNFTAGFIETVEKGGVAGGGLGVQLLFFTIGARGRVGFFKDWQLFSVGGELGFRIPIGKWEPHVDLGGGYAALGNARGAIEGAADAISIRGFYVRAGAGLDYFILSRLSLGIAASADFMGMTRPGVSLSEISKIKSNPATTDLQRASADLLALEGSGYGLSIAATGVLGVHF